MHAKIFPSTERHCVSVSLLCREMKLNETKRHERGTIQHSKIHFFLGSHKESEICTSIQYSLWGLHSLLDLSNRPGGCIGRVQCGDPVGGDS